MPLTLVHNTISVPPAPTGDDRTVIPLPVIQAQIAAVHNSTAHALSGATIGDLLVATSPVTLGVIAQPAWRKQGPSSSTSP